MASPETRASTSNTCGGLYEVFLNFRGLDTRHTFTNSLYHALLHAGFRVFIDDEELQFGEKISDNLPQAIDNSKIYIPIFSERYASSHWCLDELARMVENTSKSKEEGKKILPIFYDVKPNVVKLKTGLYNKDISNLEQQLEGQKNKFSSKNIKTWRQALKEVGGIRGWELTKYTSYTEVIQKIVDEVEALLQTREIKVPKDLVGMEDQIVAVEKLLDIDSDGVRLIGIYGMSGIGKTTLAKRIFNKLRHYFGRNCSFLDNVRETAKNDFVKLQEKLLSNISYIRVAPDIPNIGRGIRLIEEAICHKKVLIVLDDVDEANQIQNLIGENLLYSGTRILVTTRDKSILNNIRGLKYTFEEYEMVRLSKENALKLFSRHAFKDDSPPPHYYTLSERIVSTAYGLPLALEAIGSSLFGEKDREIWEEWLEKLKKTPHDDVWKKLKISYDTLDKYQQQIFLDIACFFVGREKTNAMYVWKDCGFSPRIAIKVLTRRCMMFLDDDRFGMHDVFRDLGRAIAKEERTRLWDKDDIICELRSIEIKGSVQALRLWANDETINSEQIKRFPRIQFLWLSGVICQGDFTGCLSKLKWISLDYGYCDPDDDLPRRNQCLEATNLLHLENAVVVNLRGIDIIEDVFESLIKIWRFPS